MNYFSKRYFNSYNAVHDAIWKSTNNSIPIWYKNDLCNAVRDDINLVMKAE